MKAVPFPGTLTPQSDMEKQNVLSQAMNPRLHLESPMSQVALYSLESTVPVGWETNRLKTGTQFPTHHHDSRDNLLPLIPKPPLPSPHSEERFSSLGFRTYWEETM